MNFSFQPNPIRPLFPADVEVQKVYASVPATCAGAWQNESVEKIDAAVFWMIKV